MLKAKLVVVGGDAKSAEVNLKLPTIIGRGREAGLTVPHALVSRRHAELFEKEGRLVVKDLGSLNGTFVNKNKINEEVFLEPNQLLTLGNITFRAVYEIQAQSPHSNPVQTVSDSLSDTTEDKIDFTETIPIEVENRNEPDDHPPQPESEPRPVTTTPELNVPSFSSAKNEKASDSASVLNDEADASTPGDDTDKSFIDSHVFSGLETDGDAPKSVSGSAIDELPNGPAPIVSFIGKVDFGADSPQTDSVDPVQIDLGENQKPNNSSQDDDSALGSFLKKLPK
ncbi:MAG: FHA domain-containing protein [Planctomycetota bacterium]